MKTPAQYLIYNMRYCIKEHRACSKASQLLNQPNMGHKTSGSWDDVTSLGRNDIVFEGRNKAYGAYYVRQRYNYALLLGLLFSLSTVIVGSSVPIIIKKFFN